MKQRFRDGFHMEEVPCGKCVECMKQRVNSWFVRLMEELKHCDSAMFITMTYDEHHIPYSENGLMTLNYRDFQLFMKKLRKLNDEKTVKKIKYFCAGEYGENYHRPHYHVIIFNVADPNDLHTSWDFGFIHVGKVEEKSIFYTLKYSLKRAVKNHKSDMDDDRAPEKALMSKKLGISFLTPEMITYFKDDVSRSVKMLGNKDVPLPRYYRDKLFTEIEKSARRILLEKEMDKKYEKKIDPMYVQRVDKMNKKVTKQIKKTD